MTEQEMRDSKVPWPKSINELVQYINKLIDQKHDYGTCVYAMSMSAVATLNYVAHELGVTGFQASCADMDLIRRTRNMKRFQIVDLDKLLFPQYRNEFKGYNQLIMENIEWLSKEAQKNLDDNKTAHENVLAHWKMLASQNKEQDNNDRN